METRAYWVLTDLAIVRVSSEEADGRYCVIEWLQAPGESIPLVRLLGDQTILVLDGELAVYLPAGERALGPGQSVDIPSRTPYTEQVTSAAPARVLDVKPAGFDHFLAEIGTPTDELRLPPAGEPDVERVAAAAERYGIELLGPPGERP